MFCLPLTSNQTSLKTPLVLSSFVKLLSNDILLPFSSVSWAFGINDILFMPTSLSVFNSPASPLASPSSNHKTSFSKSSSFLFMIPSLFESNSFKALYPSFANEPSFNLVLLPKTSNALFIMPSLFKSTPRIASPLSIQAVLYLL